MAPSEKPNVDVEDPAKRPSLDDQYSGPAERAVFGTMGPGGMVGLFIAILVFIVVCGTAFYFANG